MALTSLFGDLSAAGRQPKTAVLRFERERIDAHAARALELAQDTPLMFCSRLRSAAGRSRY